MIKNIQMAGVHTKLTKEEEDYITKKIGPMDRYIPKKARESARTEVKLKEKKSKDKSRFVCEVIMHLPHGQITVHEKASSMFAAIDLTEDKLKAQLRKYKEKHAGPRIHRKLVARFIRSQGR